jgi:hypothetical protein
VRLSLGKDAQDAAHRQRNKAKVHALNNGVSIVPKSGDAGHNSIATTVAEFLEQAEEVLMLFDPAPAKQTILLAL